MAILKAIQGRGDAGTRRHGDTATWKQRDARTREDCEEGSPSPRRRVAVSLLLVIIICAVNSQASQARDQAFKEYDLKAVFLYNFTQFIEWPAAAFPSDSTPIVIGVLGADPFGKSLEETVRNETIRNRKLIIEHYSRVEEIKICHILFISQSESGRLDQILGSLKERSILTVGESGGFTQRGGVIGFATEKNKIRLRVNLAAAKEANLIISSKLLRVAET